MANTDPPRAAPPEASVSERLDSWKEIAVYLKRDVRTVHRWEHAEGLPVHRHPHQRRGSVYAFKAELDHWWSDGRSHLEPSADKRSVWKSWARSIVLVLFGLLVIAAGMLLLNRSALRHRLGTAAPLEIQSIAVLPLVNLSGDPGQEYFVDGMTEELITNLGKIDGLRVISHTSVRRYKGTKRPVPEIARELNVDAIVEGMVLRSGNQVRITANLIHAPTDRHIWAESYERGLGNVLTLQSELARAIGKEIRRNLKPSEQAPLSSTPAVNPEAYDAYLKGGSILENWTEESAHLAVKYFERALDLDPAFAPAYAGLAETYIFLGRFGYVSPNESYAKARELANKALARDPKSVEAYTSLCGIATYYDWDWPAADATCRRAVELNPNHGSAHHAYAHYLVATGQFSAALQESLLYLRLDPLSPAANTHLAMQYDMARQFDLAVKQARRAVELDPNFPDAHGELTWAYLGMGRPKEAVSAARQAVNVSKGKAIYLRTLGRAYADAGMRSDAAKVLGEIRELSHRQFVEAMPMAIIHIGLGHKDEAIKLLEKAEQEHDHDIAYLRVFHVFDPLRPDPRFQALLRRVNFPQ
jgi:TolB-like protein/tetratricopeptide (TPR) repeat protein